MDFSPLRGSLGLDLWSHIDFSPLWGPLGLGLRSHTEFTSVSRMNGVTTPMWISLVGILVHMRKEWVAGSTTLFHRPPHSPAVHARL